MSINLIKAAFLNDHIKVWKEVLSGADINFREKISGQTALHYSLRSGNEKMADFLKMLGANQNIADNKGFTAFNIIFG